MGSKPQQLPYGLSDFSVISQEQMAYVDKTAFIPVLEQAGKFLFLLRPRRFGKSLSLSMLHCYYDLNYHDRFSDLFGNTWIADNPTPEQSGYMVLPFDFSQVSADPEKVETSFEWHVSVIFDRFIRRYQNNLDEDILQQMSVAPSAAGRLHALFQYVAEKQLKLYVLIDEYDNFTNTILSLPEHGTDTYRLITHADGFFRDFFKVLKGGTVGPDSPLGRLLITGVSPVTMDDVTSGFNIGIPLSLEAPFGRFAGFTRDQVGHMIDQQGVGDLLKMDKTALLDLMESWYGGYRFTEYDSEHLFNPDMVMFFLRSVRANNTMPKEMVDHNVRIDYTKLRHLVMAGRKLNGNFRRLQGIVNDGFCLTDLVTGFPLEKLTDERNFISLLHYFGLLTIAGSARGKTRLEIPNKTIETLMYGYIREAMADGGVFDTKNAVIQDFFSDMGWDGDWRPFFQYLASAIKDQTTVRDYLGGEKVVQGFLLAWLSLGDYFQVTSERELNKGFCDLYLEPFTAKYPDMKYGYLIEIKYFKRGEWTAAKQAEIIDEAKQQLVRYRQDPRLNKVAGEITWICPVLVFHGWELVATAM